MTASLPLRIVPATLPLVAQPCVGIFWRVEDCLAIARTPVTQAEPYGDCLTHSGGHYDQWRSWRRLAARGLALEGLPLAILASEYEDWPRGRVVFDTPAGRFMLYADARLHTPDMHEALVRAFVLAGQDTVMALDGHYR